MSTRSYRKVKLYIQQQKQLVELYAKAGDKLDADIALGRLLHALQDFFSHSNFVDKDAQTGLDALSPDEREQALKALYDPTIPPPTNLKLTSFDPKASDPRNPPDPIENYTHGDHAKDSNSALFYDDAYNNACMQTAEIISKMQLYYNGGKSPGDPGYYVMGVVSHDPNDLTGSRGFGTPNWVTGSQPLQYSIFFGNEDTASAPAQTVVITDKLDMTNLDLKTFSLGPITFGNTVITPLPYASPVLGVSEFNSTIDLRPANNLLVNVHASLDTGTGYLTWTFTSLDPSTGQPTDDPLTGFLPPGGEGSVLFTVNPKQSLPTGTAINDQATIIFDVNAPMDTSIWLNTLDNDTPTSQVTSLAANQNTSSFTVQWSGTDTINGVAGSGIQDFTVYVSDNGGAFTPWLVGTTATSAQYTGIYGHTYAFYSQATDNAGNVESSHVQADAMTRVNARFNLSGTITLQSAVNKAQTLTLEFRPTDGSASFTQTVTLNSDGTFSLTAVPAMTFNLAIKGSKWLRTVIPVDGTNGDVSGFAATLLPGDVNGDNQVSLADYALLRNAFGSRSTSSNWNANADLDCDGQVSLADYVLLRNNFGKKGDP